MSFHQALQTPNSTATDFDYLEIDKIYADSACQTLRPRAVIEAVDEYYQEYNSCGDRVKYEWGQRVDQAVQDTRDKILKLAGKSKREYVCVFTLNTTYGINLILSQLPTGYYRQMVTSQIEHNSVFLPSITYAKKLGLKRTVLSRQSDGSLIYNPTELERSIVLLNTTSNIDGVQLANAEHLAKRVHEKGGIIIIDGAQTMGYNPEFVRNIDFDALCFSGHKMYGPSLGVIIIKKNLLLQLDITFIGGGTVESVSENKYKLLSSEPASMLEAGLQNYSGIIGLGAAVSWKAKFYPEGHEPNHHLERLSTMLYDAVKQTNSITLLNQAPSPILSFFSDRIDSHRLAIYLSARGIMARSGYFCCHYFLDSVMHYPPLLRISLGLNNTVAEVERLDEALQLAVGGL